MPQHMYTYCDLFHFFIS